MKRTVLLCLLLIACSSPATAELVPVDPAPVPDSRSEVVTLPSLEPNAVFGGTATWYCGNGSRCTRGYGPSDLVAAIDPSTGIRKGEVLVVRHQNRAVGVTVVDVCACKGERVIDLTSGAFSQLAPLSRGVIDVAIETQGAVPTLPATWR